MGGAGRRALAGVWHEAVRWVRPRAAGLAAMMVRRGGADSMQWWRWTEVPMTRPWVPMMKLVRTLYMSVLPLRPYGLVPEFCKG